MLRFSGNLTDEPVLSRLSKKFNVRFNIRAGGIQKLQNGKVGTLLTDITGEKAELEKAFAYLKSEGIFVEKRMRVSNSLHKIENR